ncbi:hypothetical protein MRX96_032187 [Rhipicephalus microplus]
MTCCIIGRRQRACDVYCSANGLMHRWLIQADQPGSMYRSRRCALLSAPEAASFLWSGRPNRPISLFNKHDRLGPRGKASREIPAQDGARSGDGFS